MFSGLINPKINGSVFHIFIIKMDPKGLSNLKFKKFIVVYVVYIMWLGGIIVIFFTKFNF